MDVVHQKGMPTKWLQYPTYIFLLGAFFSAVAGTNCFIAGWIGRLGIEFYLISDFLIFSIFWFMLRKYNYTIIIGKDSVQKLTPIMKFGILFFGFMFAGIFSLSVAGTLLNIAIWMTSNTPTQFQTTVSKVVSFDPSSNDWCKKKQYTFANSPINTDTTVCDSDGSLESVKVGDTLLVNELVGFAGAHFLNAEHTSN